LAQRANRFKKPNIYETQRHGIRSYYQSFMKNKLANPHICSLARFTRSALNAALLSTVLSLLPLQTSHAGSATWKANPVSDDWFDPANWTPMTVPNAPTDIATFGTSAVTTVFMTDLTSLDSIVIQSGASDFTIKPENEIDFFGAGVSNSGAVATTLVNDIYPGIFGLPRGSRIFFFGTSTAGSATTFVNLGGGTNAIGGFYTFLNFTDSSSAGNATIINERSLMPDASDGGVTVFSGSSTAANATIITNGNNGPVGGIAGVPPVTEFIDSSTADNATLIAKAGINDGPGGLIFVGADASGGSARVKLFGNGTLQLEPGANTTIGSLEGGGLVQLDGNLSVGLNNLTTVFTGRIRGGGSLTKVGKGKLTLGEASTYTHGTAIRKGTLLVANRSGSATGTGPVLVAGGMLGGTGFASGSVTIGANTATGVLAPGIGNKTGVLTCDSPSTFSARAIYRIDLDSTAVTSDELVANGVTINTGATVALNDLGADALPPGTVFTIIGNTAATPISGTFTNLADGSVVTIGSNTYMASYEGGAGNDLTLTVQ
jgi:autotransporter-associated beta strand protein